jgi:hypothetical protein
MLIHKRASQAVRMLSIAVLAAVAIACVDQKKSVANDQAEMSAVSAAASAPAPPAAMSLSGVTEAAKLRRGVSQARQQPPVQAIPAQSASVAPSMIIRNGEVTVQVDSLEQAIVAVRALATSLGGYVGNVSTNTGRREIRTASLEMKIPASRFDEAMSGMIPLGKVERSSATAQDVGEEFVDVTARMDNAKRLERRLVELLATHTGKLDDVLAVERELARVREEIERYEGRLRYLSAHVATSTIVATVHEKAPIVATQPGTNPIRQAVVNMWRNFVLFLAWSIEALGILIPVAAIALGAFFVRRRWKRAPVVTTVA